MGYPQIQWTRDVATVPLSSVPVGTPVTLASHGGSGAVYMVIEQCPTKGTHLMTSYNPQPNSQYRPSWMKHCRCFIAKILSIALDLEPTPPTV